MLYDLVMESMREDMARDWDRLLSDVFDGSYAPEDVLGLIGRRDLGKAIEEFSATLMSYMVQEAFGLIRAGVTTSVEEILKWDKSERLAWKIGGEILEARQIYANGIASKGGMHAARFLAALDGGKTHDEMICDHYAKKAADLLS